MPDEKTQLDHLKHGLLNHRWIAVTVLCVGVVVGAAAFTNALASLRAFVFGGNRAETTDDDAPNIVVCVKTFTCSRTNPYKHGNYIAYSPQVKTSFRLVNKGRRPATVTKVEFNPGGIWKNGKPGGMSGIEVEINKEVAGNGVVVIDDLTFTAHIGIDDEFWIDKPDRLGAWAYWPGGGGIRHSLTCLPRQDGTWACGKAQKGALGITLDDGCK
jgi:hypothetical protein